MVSRRSFAQSLSLIDIEHSYGDLSILQGADLSLSRGEVVALTASSGAGKSTLLHIAGLLERPKHGKILIEATDGWALSEPKRSELRNRSLGFIFQFHHLLPEFNALENVMIPLRLAGQSKKQARSRAESLLAMVAMDHRYSHRPSELSGGEQQRVAVARALACQPKVLLADEPTGNLDPETAQGVFELIISLAHNFETAALIVTHDHQLARRCDRWMSLIGGKIQGASW